MYLLGKRGPLAAFLPKPGWYVTDDVYYYNASSSDFLPLGDRLVQDADVDALINIAQFTWITDLGLAGGRLAVSAVLPYGRVEVNARGAVELPDGTVIDQAGRHIRRGMPFSRIISVLLTRKRTEWLVRVPAMP